jgi:hypothetical protein
MTVENTKNKMSPLQMGVTAEFPFNFAVLLQDPTEEEALKAIKAKVVLANGKEIDLVYDVDYTVELNTDRLGGTLTVNDIRTTDDYITIYRQYEQTQEVDYRDFNSAPAETFEQCFDKLTMLSQQQQEEINRSIKLPVSTSVEANLTLPIPVAGRTLKWNEEETGLINSDVSIDEIDDFVKSANESAEIAVEKADEIAGKLDEALEVADTIKDIEIIATLEIGDIGIAPLGIDESLGKRRYLNGSVIVQDQYQVFTQRVKTAIQTYAGLGCTEEEWQDISAKSVGGQCGKFVVDDEAGTIRLPKIIMPIQGLTDLTKLGEIVEAGLPNITGKKQLGTVVDPIDNGCFTSGTSIGTHGSTGGSNSDTLFIDASKSNNIYGNSDTVQQEQIQYPYFIQVATGASVKENITNEVELNNPFVLLEGQYFTAPVYNSSWLQSNSGYTGSLALHPSAYNALLIEQNPNVEVGTTVDNYTKRGLSVKLNTEDYTDYDFVLNTTSQTFRCPLKLRKASGRAVAGNGMTLGLTNGTQLGGLARQSVYGTEGMTIYQDNYGSDVGSQTSGSTLTTKLSVGITTDPTKSGIETSDEGLYLYFYVGETVQNANLVNVGRVEEKLSECITRNDCKAYVVETYQNGTSWCRVWSPDSTGKRWCEQGGLTNTSSTGTVVNISFLKPFKDTTYSLLTGYCSTGGSNTNTYINTSSLSTIGFSMTQHAGFSHYWQASGYIA